MAGCKRTLSNLFGLGVFGVCLLAAGPGVAEWKLYVAPGLGISAAVVDTDGSASAAPTVTLSGADDDSSPLLDLAFGLEVPMDELVPREWLLDVRLPDWPVRFEFEAAGLREYELRTDTSSADDYFTQIKAWTKFANFWLDVPLLAAYRPVQYTLGLGRQPRVRRWLEPASFYFGAGVGVTGIEFRGSANTILGNDQVYDFAWNVGMGMNYALTQSVVVSAGYRYVGLGKHDVDLGGSFTAGPIDSIEYDPQVHEFRVAVRIRVFEFPSPWR